MAPTQTNEDRTLDALAQSAALMARLRGPDGCPWDREQTFDSIKPYTLEETYEVFDAIERRAWPELKDELGDLLLQVLFYAQMASEAGYFTLAEVAENLNAKLIRRHPHVFGDEEAETAGAVLRNWERIKLQEKAGRNTQDSSSLLDEVPRSMPASLEAGKLGSRAAKVGFDWPDADGLFQKLDEEIAELKAELVPSEVEAKSAVASPQGPSGASGSSRAAQAKRVESEFGDVLFTLLNLARHLRVDTESALRGTNARFRRRFAHMEIAAGGTEALREMSADELERLWLQAKLRDRADAPEVL